MRVTVLITLDQYVVSQVFDGYPANNSPSQHVGNLIYACKQAIPALYNGLRYRSPQIKLPYSHIHAKQRGPEPSLVAYRHHPTAHQSFKSHNVPVPFPTMHHFVSWGHVTWLFLLGNTCSNHCDVTIRFVTLNSNCTLNQNRRQNSHYHSWETDQN